MEKKRIKVWGKIKLFEASCCGLPVYPMAHKSYSLIKALTETEEPSDQLNIKEKTMPEEDEKAKAEAEAKAKEEAELAEKEKAEAESKAKEEAEAEAKESEETKAKEEAEAKAKAEEEAKVASMTELLANALTKAINEAEVKRGLVSPEQNIEKMQEVLKTKSLGELAIMQGIFKTDQGVGNPVSVEQ